jgi:hypothetical protein
VSGIAAAAWVGLVVDGLVVGKSPWMYGVGGVVEAETVESHRHGTVSCAVPVAAGTHRISAIVCLFATGTFAVSLDTIIGWNARAIWSREVRR